MSTDFKRQQARTRAASRKLFPLRGAVCELCGESRKRLQRHHDDYANPKLVVIVCVRCHARIHCFGPSHMNKLGRPRTAPNVITQIEELLCSGVKPMSIIAEFRGRFRNQVYQVKDRLVREGRIAS